MKKKYLIYLLTLLMALSPAAVFAETADGAADDPVKAGEALAPAAEEAVQEEAKADASVSPYDACTWTDQSTRESAKDAAGTLRTGLFKAAKAAGGTGLYYAGSDAKVIKQEQLITVSDGWRFLYHPYTPQDGEFWKDVSGGTYSYLIRNHSGDFYAEHLEGLYAVNGVTYYVKTDGTVKTDAGLFTYGGSQYYANAGGAVNTSAGFINVNGKKYLCGNGGAITLVAGVVSYGGKKYAANPDGSICTKVGFQKIAGKLYYVSNSEGVLAVNKAFKSGSKTYHATPEGHIAVGVHKWGKYYYYADSKGAIRTKKGVVKWSGNRYYVGNKKGRITTNKKVKYKGKTYIAAKNGAFRKGIFKWKKNLYFANSKGVLRTKAGVFTFEGDRYCSRSGGVLYSNKLFRSGGKKYLAQEDGTLKAGLLKWKNKLYLTNAKCEIYTKAGMYTYNGKQYYVKKGGGGPLAVSMFIDYKDKHYYAGSDGAILKKSFKYNGVTVTPNSSTGAISDEEYWKVFPEKAPKEDPEPEE